MSDIGKIDKNFKINDKPELDDVCFYNVKENPWCLFGLIYDDCFRRMPKDTAACVNDGVKALHTNTSGGRIRFRTDSEYVAIRAVMPDKVVFSHMPDTGVSGFDMYVGKDYVRTFIPPVGLQGRFEEVHHFGDDSEKEIMINFPLYNNVTDLYIGLKKESCFKEHKPYINKDKIVYYGSSITQGGCVSRPGLAYPSQVSVKLDCDFINLGFSGSARGEAIMAEYIAGTEPDIFVMDYDHNALDSEYLKSTHEKFFKIFRELKKDVPVLFLSAPNVCFCNEEWTKRRDIIYNTYKNAMEKGDRKVFFTDGKLLWGKNDWRECTVDSIHPNDLGHYRMARKIISVIKEIRRDTS